MFVVWHDDNYVSVNDAAGQIIHTIIISVIYELYIL